jgi:tRNA threonylcarbamoyladenosine biosynthesis protein TsaE
MSLGSTVLVVRRVGPEAADAVLEVVTAAFSARPALDPPAEALAETHDSMVMALSGAGGLLAELAGSPVGALVLDLARDVLYVRRFGVIPQEQHHGIAHRLVTAACDAVDEATEVRVFARQELPRTVGFWEAAGFVEVGRVPPYVELRRPLVSSYDVPTAEAMRALGSSVATSLRPGDLVVLTGELGAGKTTFTQGLGEGLGVRGGVTSPTFVIARVHPSLGSGPDLVHVDAYRLGGLAELDDLDLDASLDTAVTVVEWGEGLAESLSDSWLQVTIGRAVGSVEADADDPRVVRVRGYGPRWASADR